MDAKLPGVDPIGEAWVLSDRDDFPSLIAEGPLAGKNLKELIASEPAAVMGRFASKFSRFPLLLKFLDAREMLSVQVHPSDSQKELLPPGENGKTEAWVVLESEPGSKIYAGLKPGTTAQDLRTLSSKSADNHLASISPEVGEGVFIESGTVHALGGGVVVFEVQENSDVTFRLFDWDRIDAKTGKSRELHIDDALKCIDLNQGPRSPVQPVVEEAAPMLRERVFDCAHFILWRHESGLPFSVGAAGEPRVLVCVGGGGRLEVDGGGYKVGKGEVFLIPASVGLCGFTPAAPVNLLEIGLPG